MITKVSSCDAAQREMILEALEERIVLDAAVDPTDAVDHDTADGGLDPSDGYWTWEHAAWCYSDGSTEWWWWPDSSSPYGGNWLTHTVSQAGMWNYDWDDGWEWFFDAFYNNRYFYENNLYWGQDGSHNWYYTDSFNTDFAQWTAVDSLDGVVYVDFEPYSGTAECRTVSGSWAHSGRLVFYDTEYAYSGWHTMDQFDPDLYDGIGWSHEPTSLPWQYQSGSNSYYCSVYGDWSGNLLMTYNIENPGGGVTPGYDLDVIFMFHDDPNFHYLEDYMGLNWRVYYYDSGNFSVDSWVYYSQLISYAEGSIINDLAIMEHGAANSLYVGNDCVTSYNFYAYSYYFTELGEVLDSSSSVQSWHCSVAGSVQGENLCDYIAQATGALMWASDSYTCIVPNGDYCTEPCGDRSLEYGTDGWGTTYGPSWSYSWFESPWNEALMDPDWLERC